MALPVPLWLKPIPVFLLYQTLAFQKHVIKLNEGTKQAAKTGVGQKTGREFHCSCVLQKKYTVTRENETGFVNFLHVCTENNTARRVVRWGNGQSYLIVQSPLGTVKHL